MKSSSQQQKWPVPKYDEADQPHFLFVITPPYSGSTALSELLNSSHKTMILQTRGEGQWLVPGLCGPDRWNAAKVVNYASVKAVWLARYQEVKRLTQNIDVVIEKSPPNMMRIEELASQFQSCSFLANNRDPYANCASILYRQHRADDLDDDARKEILASLVKAWIDRSVRVRELVSGLAIPLLTYEEFCANPASVLSHLNLPDGVVETINPDVAVRVKDYDAQPIANQNERQIAKLKDEEMVHISGLLTPFGDLLEFFDYSLLR